MVLHQRGWKMQENAITYHIEDFFPENQKDCTPVIQRVLDAVREGKKPAALYFQKKEYHFYKDLCQVREYHTSNTDSAKYPQKHIAILLEGLKDVTVEGRGAHFIFHGDVMALAVVDCENIVLRNFSWDYEAPTVSEMQVEALGQEQGQEYTDFLVPQGCPFTLRGNSLVWNGGVSPYTGEYYWQKQDDHGGWTWNGWQPDTNLLRRYKTEYGPFLNIAKMELLKESQEGRRVRIFYANGRPLLQTPGFVYEMLATPIRETAGAFFSESRKLLCENVNPCYLHSFGWLVQMCQEVQFKDCRFEPGKDTGRRCTSYADSIHVSGASGSFTVENCRFTHSLDDCINIHGTYTRVKQQDGVRLTLQYVQKQQTGFLQYHKGDVLEFFHRSSLTSICDARTEPVSFKVLETTAPLTAGNDEQTMEVLLDQTPVFTRPLMEYVAENVSYTPSVTIRGCHFSVVPTRGILCTTRKKVVIENNTFRHMTMCPIFLSNDSNEWYESGIIEDLTIRGNKFYQSGTASNPEVCMQVSKQDGLAAIHIYPEVMEGTQKRSGQAPVHKNITIEENEFFLKTGAALVAEKVEGLRFCHNQIHMEAEHTGKNPVLVSNCKHVVLEHNDYIK